MHDLSVVALALCFLEAAVDRTGMEESLTNNAAALWAPEPRKSGSVALWALQATAW